MRKPHRSPFRFAALALAIAASAPAAAQQTAARPHVGRFLRADSLPIVFNLSVERAGGREQWVIRNADERITVRDIRRKGDSVFVEMPVFDSRLRLRTGGDGTMSGVWVKGTERLDAVQPVRIRPGSQRFRADAGRARHDVSGRWRVTFTRPNGTQRFAIAEFQQRGDRLTGTFVTPSGDYRYLEGIVSGDSLRLSCFDGSHAYFFGARLADARNIVNGVFAAGLTHLEPWTAVRDPDAVLDESSARTEMREGMQTLGFRFPDLDSNLVSLGDERFKGKVVVIQIMGSWCPNCMDETGFLSEYYRANRQKGVEMVALAYEYSDDFQKARRGLLKFRDRYGVGYPMLITGVSSADEKRTEKTLPELTPIRVFPTTIFVGRDGKVKRVHAGFSGPATGSHHEEYKRSFQETVDSLLK